MDRTLEEVLAHDGYRLVVDERFDEPRLDRSRWLPHHLPHWSSRAASAARYDLIDGTLQLRIDADQQPWCPDLDGQVRVSSLQTGVFAGPLGSSIGQHHFKPGATVREAQDESRLYTPRFGVFVARATALLDPNAMVALWMCGFEDQPEHSGVIDVFEIFGRDTTADRAEIGMSVKAFADPDLRDDIGTVELEIDVREFHDYALQWTPDRVVFFVDGQPVRTIDQSPQYEMQFMLGIYEFEPTADTGHLVGAAEPVYPKRFVVDRFQAYETSEWVATTRRP